MALSAGARLGPYEILCLIGAGGMGEVYKAIDTRLDRTVAIKVLPADISNDPDRQARFEREAKTIAGLDHPHICALHDVGEHRGAMFLVMEHLQGETLAHRIEKGRVPIDQALTIAIDIADALSAAHRQGVIHRDLKPANVILTKAGAKLLDFGLAKLTGHGEQPVVAYSTSAVPTKAATLTGQGVIVGTLQYMAPEQLEGKPADARTDLWALGAIVYEMLTGKRAFEGTSAVSLMTSIMEREAPPISSVAPLTPPALDRLVRRCLAKNADDRWDSAHDVADELRWIRTDFPRVSPSSRRSPWAAAWLVVTVALLATISTITVVWTLRPARSDALVVRSLLDIAPATEVDAGGTLPAWTPGGSRTALAWAPDGRAVVFVGRRDEVQQLYIRELDRSEARALPGTEGAQVPAVSPDGEWIAFWSVGAIRKVPTAGGPSLVVYEPLVVPPDVMTWSTDGHLMYSTNGTIWQVSSGGGTPTALAKPLPGEWRYVLPQALPGARAILYTVRRFPWIWSQEEIVAQTLATGARTPLLRDAVDARYVSSGHLVFLRRGTLLAVPFDPARLEIRGSPVPLLEGVAQALTGASSGDVTGAGQFSVAPTGTLAYVSGSLTPYRDATVMVIDRRGRLMSVPIPVHSYTGPLRISPDGRRIALVIRAMDEQSVWLYDIARGTLGRLTKGGVALWPQWTPDGQRITTARNTAGTFQIGWRRADASGPEEVLLAKEGFTPSAWSRDGRELLAVTVNGDIWVLSFAGSTPTQRPLVQSTATEQAPEFSPDGRAFAYESDESGRFEVYVQPYPGPGTRMQVSIDGGRAPAWNPQGGELFYVRGREQGPRELMTVDVRTNPAVSVGRPRALFEITEGTFATSPNRCYDVAPDGQHFFVIRLLTTAQSAPVTHINLIENWFVELKAKVPTK